MARACNARVFDLFHISLHNLAANVFAIAVRIARAQILFNRYERTGHGSIVTRQQECGLFLRLPSKLMPRSAAGPPSQSATQASARPPPDRKRSADSANTAATCRSTGPDASRCPP